VVYDDDMVALCCMYSKALITRQSSGAFWAGVDKLLCLRLRVGHQDRDSRYALAPRMRGVRLEKGRADSAGHPKCVKYRVLPGSRTMKAVRQLSVD
jgi:hypothetical protein